MTFFSRPNLDNIQFKQLVGSELTLSGQTHVANTTGFTISDEFGQQIPIITTGGSTNYVLTYNGGKISLAAPTLTGGTDIYVDVLPTTCTVGGLDSGSNVTGLCVAEVLKCILTPTLFPTLINPSTSLSIVPEIEITEVGCQQVICATSTLNLGCITPQYTSALDTRSCGAIAHKFSTTDSPVVTTIPVISTCLSYAWGITLPISAGINEICNSASYLVGIQPKDSAGGNYCIPLVAGNTNATTHTINGVYPYFWGSSVAEPILTSDGCAQCLVTGGTKCVDYSDNDVLVSNYNVTGEYVWLAIPSISTSKTKWQGGNSPSNCGIIPGDLFTSGCTRNISSTSSYWSSTSYNIYISCYPTSVNYSMTFKNS